MTDKELNAIEIAAKAVPHGPLKKDIRGINNELGIYLAVASPDAILELIAELKQARKERDWLLKHMDEENCPPDKNEYSCWKNLTDVVKTDCKKCWLEAAKEAVK